MDASDLPELATNKDWRGIMKRARGDHGMTQEDLANAVGKLIKDDPPSQVVISKIESGAIKASRYVLPICELLSIDPPEHYVNQDDRDWVRLGRVLRSKDIEQYRRWTALLESIVGPEEEEPEDDSDDPRPTPTRK